MSIFIVIIINVCTGGLFANINGKMKTILLLSTWRWNFIAHPKDGWQLRRNLEEKEAEGREEHTQSFLDRCFHIAYCSASPTLLFQSLKRKKGRKGIHKLKVLSQKLHKWGSSSEDQWLIPLKFYVRRTQVPNRSFWSHRGKVNHVEGYLPAAAM